MKLIIDTDKPLSKQDIELLRLLDPDLQRMITKLQEDNAALSQKLQETELKLARAPSGGGPLRKGLTEEVKRIFEEPDAMYSAQELAQMLGHDNPSSVYQTCYKLRDEGLLEKTTTRPTKFFKKSTGNPELRDAVPRGTKISHMG